MQEQKVAVNAQKPNQRPLFPHPPTQHFKLPVIPPVETNNWTTQVGKNKNGEHFRKSPMTQIKETQPPKLRLPPHQRSCQDVRMDPRYQKPPHYSQIQHH